MAIGGAGAWIAVGVFWGRWVDPTGLAAMPDATIAAILVIALFNTTLTQFLWIGGLASLPDMTRGAYLFFLKPVIAAALAVIFLGNTLSALQIAAAAPDLLDRAGRDPMDTAQAGDPKLGERATQTPSDAIAINPIRPIT